ncbi:hypothetical protein Q3G72_016462 [Acer saccharum]|nr:hypothetical protein Q3G72_016462 [Acer saccharum]
MGNEGKEVRVLMVTLALQGHLNPTLRFAKRLVSKGVHVTLATTEVSLQSKSPLDCTTIAAHDDQAPRVHFQFFSDGLDDVDADRRNDSEFYFESLKTKGSINLSSLITNLTNGDKNKKISCIIINPFTPWAADIALQHEIPCAVLWIQACTVFSIYYHYFKHQHLFPYTLENPNDVVSLPAMPVLQVKELPSFILPDNPLIMKRVLSDLFQRLDNIKWVLGNSFDALEIDVVASMASINVPIIPIGPLVSPFMLGKEETVAGNVDIWSVEDYCIEFLDKKPISSVVYISFGSINVLTQDQMDNVATALKNSNRPFLWVIKPPEKISGMKSGELPTGFLEDTKDRGLVVKWCPQERVLMHSSVACFVTHCGWNSTLETVVGGVPVVAFPKWSDQPIDAKVLVDVLKMGVKMRIYGDDDGVFSDGVVERCIAEVADIGLKATEMKKRAVALKEAAKKAVEDGGSSDMNIDRFISEIEGVSC